MNKYKMIEYICVWGLMLSAAARRAERAEAIMNFEKAERYNRLAYYCANRMGRATGWAQRNLELINKV